MANKAVCYHSFSVQSEQAVYRLDSQFPRFRFFGPSPKSLESDSMAFVAILFHRGSSLFSKE